MEVGSQHVVDEFLLLVPVFGASCLVLEDHIVIPSALHGEVFRIEQRIASGDVDWNVVSKGLKAGTDSALTLHRYFRPRCCCRLHLRP